MGGTSSYLAILCIIGFLCAAWLATKLSKLLGVSAIVLEIAVGIVLGPHLAGLMSDEYATCDRRLYTDCTLPSDVENRVLMGLSFGEDLDKVAHEHCWSWDPTYAHSRGQGMLPYGGQGTQYGGQGTQYGGQGAQYGGQGAQYGGQGTQYGGQGTQQGGQGTQYGGQGTQHGGQGTQYGGQGTQYGGQGSQNGGQGTQYGGAGQTQTGGQGSEYGGRASQTQVEQPGGQTGTYNPYGQGASQTQAEQPGGHSGTYNPYGQGESQTKTPSTSYPYGSSSGPSYGMQTQIENSGSGGSSAYPGSGGGSVYSTTQYGGQGTQNGGQGTQYGGQGTEYGTQVEPSTSYPYDSRSGTTGYPGGNVGTTTQTRTRVTTTRITATRAPGWDDEDDTVFPMGGNDDTDGIRALTGTQNQSAVQGLQLGAQTLGYSTHVEDATDSAGSQQHRIPGHADKAQWDYSTQVEGPSGSSNSKPYGYGEVQTQVEQYGGGSRRLESKAITDPSNGNIKYDASKGNGGNHYQSYPQCISQSCQAQVSHDCALAPDVFSLIGHVGVALMLFESGLHFDFEKAQAVGPKAMYIALSGTILPLVTGTGLMMIYGYPLSPDGISVGTALAPTSAGLALRLLGGAGVLQEDVSQAIVAAAFFNDILSLVLYDVICSLRGKFDAIATVLYPIVGVVFMLICMVAAVKFWPKVINELILPRLAARPNVRASLGDEALFIMMMALLIAFATVTHYLNTYLWGCFIAGMSLSCIDKEGQKGHTHHVWVRQTKRITSWMIRIFFACTVAFSIPTTTMFSSAAVWKGSIMGLGPCILGKVLCAPFMGNAQFVIGWAMVGRAEFAYFIAQMTYKANMINDETFSICIWALLYATIFSPFIFRTVLGRYISAQGIEIGPAVDVDELADQSDDEDVVGNRKRVSTAGAADYQQRTVGATRRKVDFDASADASSARAGGKIENTQFGKFDDLKQIAMDADGGMAAAQTAAPTTRRLWFGRSASPAVSDSPNGFLCCLFMRRIVVN